MWSDFKQDLVYGIRSLARTPAFTCVALVTLACALFLPDRPEELRPELWSAVPAPGE